MSLSSIRKRPSNASGLGAKSTKAKHIRTKMKVMGASVPNEFSDLMSALATQSDLFAPTTIRLHPRFRTLLIEDAAQSKRSMNMQLMIG